MNTVQTDEQGIIVPCAACGKRNRIAYNRIGETGQCGNCHADIPAPSVPIEVTSESAFDSLTTESPVPVVVDYWAPWCPPCRAVAPEFDKVARLGAGRFVVAKVNTEALPNVGARAGVQAIPTMIVFQDGKELSRTQGARPASQIEDFVRDATSTRA
jgi:thioredoxin 2